LQALSFALYAKKPVAIWMAAKLTGVSTPAQIATGFLLIDSNLAQAVDHKLWALKSPQL
jgi:hypothetical protein